MKRIEERERERARKRQEKARQKRGMVVENFPQPKVRVEAKTRDKVAAKVGWNTNTMLHYITCFYIAPA